FFFSSRRRHTRFSRDWSSDVCSSDLGSHWTSRTRSSVRKPVTKTQQRISRSTEMSSPSTRSPSRKLVYLAPRRVRKTRHLQRFEGQSTSQRRYSRRNAPCVLNAR